MVNASWSVDSCVIVFEEMSMDDDAEGDSAKNTRWTAQRVVMWHGKMPRDSSGEPGKDRK